MTQSRFPATKSRKMALYFLYLKKQQGTQISILNSLLLKIDRKFNFIFDI